jgi:non-specific serine/threonine protein kinase
MTLAYVAISTLALDQLDATVARARGEQAYALARESGSLHFIHASASQLISACVETNDIQRASEISAAFDPALPDQTVGQRRFWLARAELALAQGNPRLALQMTDRLLATALNLTHEGDIPIVARLRGDALAALGRDDDAERSLRAAVDGAAARGMRPLLWQVHAALARLLDRTGRDREAEEAATAALEIINSIATGIADEHAAAAFRERAFALLPRQQVPRPQPTANLLTSRERDVALLVARGQTNREIAEALFIGERTVETHVGNILGKLNFSTRSQIAAWVVETEQRST